MKVGITNIKIINVSITNTIIHLIHQTSCNCFIKLHINTFRLKTLFTYQTLIKEYYFLHPILCDALSF